MQPRLGFSAPALALIFERPVIPLLVMAVVSIALLFAVHVYVISGRGLRAHS
jgi:hypothetical protein